MQGYILESPFRDLVTAVRNRTETYLPPVLDRVAFTGLRLVAPVLLPNFRAISPVEAIEAIPSRVPVLILSGSADTLARPEEARELFDRVRSHARIAVIPGAGHHNLMSFDPTAYRQSILDFCSGITPVSAD